MKIELDNLYWYQARDLLAYCLDKGIDPETCQHICWVWGQPIRMADETKPWIIDVPEAHVTWLALKGII